MDTLIRLLGKFTIVTAFGTIIGWFVFKVSMLVTIFPDYRINLLCVSLVVFMFIIAVKRGLWH